MKNRILLPTILFPYVIVGLFTCGFFIRPYLPTVLSELFFSAFEAMLAALVLHPIVAIVCNIRFIKANRTTDPLELMQAALKIKYLHIPTYLLVLLECLFLGFMIYMTAPLLLTLLLADIITLCLSDMISIFAIVRSIRTYGVKEKTRLTVTLICQFFFCLDVISLMLAKRRLAKKAAAELPAEQ